MPSICLLNTICRIAFTICLLVVAPTHLFAQDEDTSAADDYGNIHIAATGTDLFAVPVPGEIYSPFIGKIGHRSTDMVIKGNGPLSIAITREHEETPKAYPYALGTMSLNNPRLVITTGVTSSEYNSTAPRTLSCNTWNKSIFGGDIQFEHPGGMVRLIQRKHLLDRLLEKFPSEALFISNNNWYVSCDTTDPSKFMIHSPDGTRFTTGKSEWHPKTIVGYNAAYTMYIETIEKAGSSLVYDYENDTNSNAGVLSPLVFTTNIKVRGIRNKQRLKSITLIDGSESPRTVNLSYRSSAASECPHLLDRIGSKWAPNGEIFYEYTQREVDPYSQTQCELTGVRFRDGSRWKFEYDLKYTLSSLGNHTSRTGRKYNAEELLGTRSLYLPLRSVTTPTGAKATYTYIHLYECKYKTVYGSNKCSARRPAISTRTVEDSDTKRNSIPSETHTVTYDNTNATLASSARRTIVNSVRKHELYFNVIDRSSHIKSSHPDDVAAKANSSKIKTHYVFSIGSNVPISGVEYEYAEMRNFLDNEKIATPGGLNGRKTWQWAYEAPRNNLIKTTFHFDGSLLQTEMRQFNIYNQPGFIDEHNIKTGEKRTTWRSYDNNYGSKNRWVIGLVDREHSGTPSTSDDRMTIQRTFDTDGQIKSEQVHGFETSYVHNIFGALNSSTDGVGNTTHISGYNNGVPTIKFITPGTNGTARTSVHRNTGLVTRTVDESGVRVDYEYDNMGRLSKTWKGNDLDNRWSTFAAVWHDKTHKRYRNKLEANVYGRGKTTYYDALGRVTLVVEHGVRDLYPTIRTFQKYSYDKLGRVFKTSYKSGTNYNIWTSWPGVTTTYDAVDRIVTQRHSGSPGQITYCYGVACNSNGFGTNGRVKYGYAVKDQEGFVSVYNFRVLGNTQTNEVSEIYQQIDNDNNWVGTWIDRNIHGFITQVAQGQYKTNAVVRTFTPYVNERRNTLTMLPGSETHPEFGTRRVTAYDNAGNMTMVENFSGNTLTYTYTNRNQIDTVQSSDGSYSVDNDYQNNGFLKKMSTPSTTWEYIYAPGRSLLESESLTTDGKTLTLSYGYDTIENLKTLTYPNGITATYTYNPFGQPESLMVNSGDGDNEIAKGAKYFPNGQLGALNLSNGLKFTSTQNTRTLPETYKVQKQGGINPPQDMVYTYDARLNVKGIENYLYPHNGAMRATYDGLNRLKTVSGFIWGGAEGVQYDYDRVGNIKRAHLDGYELNYSYSRASNLLNRVTSSNTSKARSYTGIAYDDNGNVTSTDGSDTMSYDEMNQMLSSSHSTHRDGVAEVTNRYDGQGYRIKTTLVKNNRTKSTYSLYNQAGNLLYEMDAESGEQRSHLFFNGKSIATLGANATADADRDGVPDYYERLHGMDPYNAADAIEDADGDTIDNLSEYRLGSLAQSSDSDGDGLPDDWERRYGGRINDASDSFDDPDGDGASNYNEYLANTNPVEHLASDTDYLVPSVHILFP